MTITLTVTDEIDESRASISLEAGRAFDPLGVTIADSGFVYIVDGLQPIEIAELETLSLLEGVRVVVLKGGFLVKGTLTLREGVSIAFMSGDFAVEGKMIVQGAAGEEVIVGAGSCGSSSGEWSGIRLLGAAEGDFSYMRVYSAADGIIVQDEGSSLEMDHCTVIYNSGYGVEVVDGATCTMRDCMAGYSDVGLYIRNSNVSVAHSDISYNDDTGVLMSTIDPSYSIEIDSCDVSNNGQYGFNISGYARPEIHYCSIFLNGVTEIGTAVRLDIYLGTDPIMATDNFWGLNKDTEQEISALIWDLNDDVGLNAEVIFDPWIDSPAEGVALSIGARGKR